MKETDFLQKIKTLEAYSKEHKTITFFEISQLFGPSLFNLVIFAAALPLLVFSTQWIVFPLTTFIIMCMIWYFFDDDLWTPDRVKAIKISSDQVEKTAIFIEKICEKETWPDVPVHFWKVLRLINMAIITFTAFRIGYIDNPGQFSFSEVFTILILSFALS